MNAFLRTARLAAIALFAAACGVDFEGKTEEVILLHLDTGDYADTGTDTYVDADGDGWPREYDCHDGVAAVNPGAPEICNDIDDNCNGRADENCDGGTDGSDGSDGTDGSDGSDGSAGTDGTDGGSAACDVRIAVDGDSSVEGDSTHYAEVYVLPQDSGGRVISTAYWPAGDWSSQSHGDLSEALSYSDGGTDSGTFTFTGARVASVKLNGGVWSSSSGGGSFLRWLVGSYSDTSGASFEVELSCDGDAYVRLDCAKLGNDMVCD